jgi:hypothetical protein
MSYYGQGDFYGRGGYYRGDPGFFSFLGKIAKPLVSMIPGVGPAIASALPSGAAKVAAKAGPTLVRAIESPTAAGKAMSIVKSATGIIKKHPVLSAAGAAGAGGILAGMGAEKLLRGGGGGHRRRMNPCNARALRRAIRRAHAFERLAKKVIGFSSPRKPKGRMYFKAKRKR